MTEALLLAEPAVLFFNDLDEDDRTVIWFRMKRGRHRYGESGEGGSGED
jgi:hypothetical protein